MWLVSETVSRILVSLLRTIHVPVGNLSDGGSRGVSNMRKITGISVSRHIDNKEEIDDITLSQNSKAQAR